MRFRQALLTVDGKTLELRPNRANTFDTLYVDFQFTESVEAGVRYSMFLHPKQDVLIQGLELQFELKMPAGTRFFANGYQSADASGWTHPGKDKLHSWTYTCIRQGDAETTPVTFLGSLNERTGFTHFSYDPAIERLCVRKELGQLLLRHSFPVLDVWVGEGPEAQLFGMFARLAEIQSRPVPDTAWSSRYLPAEQRGAAQILEQLEGYAEALQQCPAALRPESGLFLLDEGWGQAIGDWMPSKAFFPGGIAAVADKVREKGLMPGLWIAPFVASTESALLKKNPEWALKDAKGNAMSLPGAPALYALNVYHEGFREYLSGVFHLLLDKWGFECLRLAHLHAAALVSPPGKTQGAVMWEAMEFLRDLAGKRYLWASDAPLGACLGNVDYWDPGPAIAGHWKTKGWLGQKAPKNGAALALKNLLTRRRWNGAGVQLAGDICGLDIENQGLSTEQQQTYQTVQALLGGLYGISGAFRSYTELQRAEWEEALGLRHKSLEKVFEVQADLWIVAFMADGQRWSAYINLDGKEKNTHTANGGPLLLRPFETMILKT